MDKKLDQLAAARQAPARPTQPQEDPNKVYELPVGTSPVKGPVGAKVAIVEFADFQ
jgi:protein-disulfide isomerase